MRRRLIFLAPVFLVLFLAFVALGGQVVRLLWNWLLPPLFGWPAITFWQALGMLALCRILFGGFAMHGRRRMSPEERERFRRGIGRHFGFGPSASETRSAGPEIPGR